MNAESDPERTKPIDDPALRAAWRRALRRKIAAAGVAFAPRPGAPGPAWVPDAQATLDGWIVNPNIWTGGAPADAAGDLANAARQFARDTENEAIDAAVAHPVTGMPLPLVLDPATREALVSGRADPARAAFGLFVPPDWRRQRSRWANADLRAASRSLAVDRYAVLRGLLTPGHLAALRGYVRALLAWGLMTFGDSQVPKRHRLYDEPVMHGLHRLIAPLIERVVGEAIVPSYAYLATYVDGADLPAHLDRPQCKWNVSLALDQTPDLTLADSWPIYVQPDDRALAVHLLPGDAVIYSGTDIVHGRLPLPPGQTATLCFLHFVGTDFADALA